jgi:hypothetical protein
MNSVNDDPAHIRYLSVVISPEGIAEVNTGSKPVFVPRSDIVAAELMTGIAAERPITQAVVALAFIGLGVAGIVACMNWLAFGGTLYDIHIVLTVNILLGGWLLRGVLRKRTFILTRTAREARKIVFNGKIDPDELSAFIERARRDCNYPITSHLHGIR